jgi:hypothetical protein
MEFVPLRNPQVLALLLPLVKMAVRPSHRDLDRRVKAAQLEIWRRRQIGGSISRRVILSCSSVILSLVPSTLMWVPPWSLPTSWPCFLKNPLASTAKPNNRARAPR